MKHIFSIALAGVVALSGVSLVNAASAAGDALDRRPAADVIKEASTPQPWFDGSNPSEAIKMQLWQHSEHNKLLKIACAKQQALQSTLEKLPVYGNKAERDLLKALITDWNRSIRGLRTEIERAEKEAARDTEILSALMPFVPEEFRYAFPVKK